MKKHTIFLSIVAAFGILTQCAVIGSAPADIKTKAEGNKVENAVQDMPAALKRITESTVESSRAEADKILYFKYDAMITHFQHRGYDSPELRAFIHKLQRKQQGAFLSLNLALIKDELLKYARAYDLRNLIKVIEKYDSLLAVKSPTNFHADQKKATENAAKAMQPLTHQSSEALGIPAHHYYGYQFQADAPIYIRHPDGTLIPTSFCLTAGTVFTPQHMCDVITTVLNPQSHGLPPFMQNNQP